MQVSRGFRLIFRQFKIRGVIINIRRSSAEIAMIKKPLSQTQQTCYGDTLDETSRKRYDDKIKIIGDRDPYKIQQSEWSSNVDEWPDMIYPDILDYLVNKVSAYTVEDMRAYKSLDSYKYFVSGWVKDIGVVKEGELYIMSARVHPSHCMNDSSMQPWLIANKKGGIITAHCTCTAGLGGSCSHVVALMLAIDTSVRQRDCEFKPVIQSQKDLHVQDLPCAVQKVGGKTIREIDFTSAKSKKLKLDKSIENATKKPVPKIPEPTDAEIRKFFADLHATGTKPVVLSLIPEYSHHYIPKELGEDSVASDVSKLNSDS